MGYLTPLLFLSVILTFPNLWACDLSLRGPIEERMAPLQLSDCEGVQNFIVSDDPNFKLTSEKGVKVKILEQAPDNSYIDVSVSYPTGVTGSLDSQYSISQPVVTKRTLVVVVQAVDENGYARGAGTLDDPKIAERIVFGDKNGFGPDGVTKGITWKEHIHQSTNGRINIEGEVYPEIIKIPISKFRKFLEEDHAVVQFLVADAIKEVSPPGYLDQFDWLIGFSSTIYSVQRSGYYLGDLSKSKDQRYSNLEVAAIFNQNTFPDEDPHFQEYVEETVTSHDLRRIVTNYNVSSVDGVWLKSDPQGKNYYKSNGSTLISEASAKHVYISLGEDLPAEKTEVIVRYKPVTYPSSNMLRGPGWYLPKKHSLGWHLHELYHNISRHITVGGHIGDAYNNPHNTVGYDIMAHGGRNTALHPIYQDHEMDYSALLDGYTRYKSGWVNPATLKYGVGVQRIRIYRSSFDNVSDVENRTTLVKVPLAPDGDIYPVYGFYGCNTCSPRGNFSDTGNPFLLLEVRSKADFSGQLNYDRALPSEGLSIIRVHENGSDSTYHGSEYVQYADASSTLPANHYLVSRTDSVTLFGRDSGQYTYIAGEVMQQKYPNDSSFDFEYLLSEGTGSKTLYLKYLDASGRELGTDQLAINAPTHQPAENRFPSMTASTDYKYGFVRIDLQLSSVNKLRTLVVEVDGELEYKNLYYKNSTKYSSLDERVIIFPSQWPGISIK